MTASRRLAPRLLMLAGLAVLTLAVIVGIRLHNPSPAQAQTPIVLVKNTAIVSGSSGFTLNATFTKGAQAFTTGTNDDGYTLDSIGFKFQSISDTSTAGADLQMTLNADNNGEPGNVLCTLTDPPSFTSSGVQTFGAPSTCPTLTKETTYHTVVERVQVSGGSTINRDGTTNDSEDTGSATGWSIANGGQRFSSNTWATAEYSHQIDVRGSVFAPPNFLVKNTAIVSGSSGFTLNATFTKGAQAFTTGTNDDGYTLDSIGFKFHSISDTSTAGADLQMTLNADNSGEPGNVLCTLTDPPSFTSSGVQTFGAPSTCPTLTKETTYHTVVERVQVSGGSTINRDGTTNDSEDTGSATGWSIANGGQRFSSNTWSATSYNHQIDVRGSPVMATTTNAQPTFSADTATRTLPENSGAGVDVVGGTITATDSDSGDTLTYSLTGTDAGSFEIDSNGQIATKSGVTTHDFNFEATKNSYSVTVNVSDSKDADGNADTVIDDTIAVTINLTNVNEAPEITTSATTASVAENSTAVLTLAASDVDASDTKTWSVESTSDGGKFTITSSGALSFTNAPDFETPDQAGSIDNEYVVTVKVTDGGGLTDTHTITVTVTNVNEAGTGIAVSFAAASLSVEEGEDATVTVTLAEAPAAGTTVTAPITATPGAGLGATEYSGVPGSVTFNAGETSKSFTVSTRENTDDAPDKALTLSLGTLPEGYVPGTNAALTLTIEDDDDPIVAATFDRATASAGEGTSITITVGLSQAPEREVVLPLTATPGANLAADEYSGVPASVTFGPNDTDVEFTVSLIEDAIMESDEVLTLAFGTRPDRVTLGANPQFVLTVIDDDGTPVAPANLAVTTGSGFATLSWPTVQSDSPVLRYEVRWRETDGGSFNAWQSVGLETTYRVEGLTDNTEYTFEVQAVNAHGNGEAASESGTPTPIITGIPTAPQHLNVKNTESGIAKIRWTRPANALQQEVRFYQLETSIIRSYELQVCNSAADSCRHQDNDNWYVLAMFNNHWTRSFTHQVLAPGVIRDNRYRVRAININGVVGPWSNVGKLEPTVIEHLLTRSPQHDTVWADFRVVHNPDGKPLYVRYTNLGDGSTGHEQVLLTRKGDYRVVLTGLIPQNHYRVDLDFVDTFDSERKLSGWVWTPREGVFPLQSIYGKNVMDAELFTGGAWQDAGGRALTIKMGETGKYRVRMHACSGERTVYARRTSNVAGQLRATPVDADPFQSEPQCDSDGLGDWKEITVTARPLNLYPSDMRTEALLRTPFAVQYKHEVWETKEGSPALVSDSSAWVKVLVDRPASAVLPDPSNVTFTDPAAGSTGGPTMSWNAVEGASSYLVEWRHGLNYSNRANQDRVRITGTSASIPMGPSGHGPITARVRAYSTSGISNWVETTWDSRQPTLKVTDTTIFEADGLAGFLVTLNPAASGQVTVGYSTSPESAIPTLDYVAAAGILTFQPGVTTQTVWVSIINDDVDDSGETFSIALSNPTGSDSVNGRAVIADGVAIATILNRDQQASLSATLPDTASTSKSHSGDLDNPTVVVAFNQAVTSFTKETPSVSVTGATVVSVAAHTEAGMEHTYLVTLDPEGDDDVTFSLIPEQSCITGGICTNARNMLSTAPAPLTITGPEEVVITSYMSVGDATASEEDDATIDFVVTLSPASDEAVTVDYATANGTAVAGGDYKAKSGTLTFAAGQTSRTVQVSLIDDDLEEDQETLDLNLTNPSGAAISDAQGTGTIDGTELARLTARFINMPDTHDGDKSFSFAIEFSHDVDTSEADMKASALTVTNGQVTEASKISGLSYLWEVTVEPDSDNDVVITFSGNRDCAIAGAVCKEEAPRQLSNNPAARVAGPAEDTASDESGDDGNASDGEPLTATFSNVPASHDGATAFTFDLAFSQDVTAGLESLRDDAFSVSGGNINQVRRTDPASDRNWTLRVKPEGDGPITITLPATTDCQADGAICTEEGAKLSTGLQVTVGGPEAQSQEAEEVQNNDAAGAPTVTGTPRVGQVLTADTSLIADEDGLTNVSYEYQWLADGTDIEGATGSSYELTASEQGQTIQVRVSFTDDANNEESLTSEATVEVAAAPAPLTASVPDSRFQSARHNGADDRPQVIVAFSLPVASFEKTTPSVSLTGATVSSVRLHEEDGLQNSWIFFLDPDGDADIVFSLATGQPCDSGGICTEDGGMLSEGVRVTLPGPEEEDQQTPESPPAKPTNLTAAVNADGHIVLSWTAPDDDSVTGYQILRRRPSEGESALLVYVEDTRSTATTFTDTGVTAGVKHVYRVKAINAAGLSDWSNYVNPTP